MISISWHHLPPVSNLSSVTTLVKFPSAITINTLHLVTIDPEIAKRMFENNITNTTYRTPYPVVNPSRPELSQKGKTVLITKGSTGIGFASV